MLVKCGRVKGAIKMSDNPFSFIPDLNMDGKRDYFDLMIMEKIIKDIEDKKKKDDEKDSNQT